MSKVADILNSNENQQGCVIFFDPDSLDSLLGAAILKYACQEITAVNETLLIQPVDQASKQTFVIETENGTIPTHKNINFVGCIPDDETSSKLVSVYKKNLLYMLCDSDLYNTVKGLGASIEYDESESVSLHLYKIIFGELQDGIPEIFRIVSKGVTKQFDNDYETYLRFYYGFILKYAAIADYVRLDSIYDDIVNPLFKKNTSYDTTQILNSGLDIINGMNNAIALHLSGIKSDKWTVNNNIESYALFSNGPMLPSNINGGSIVNYFPLNVLISFYRKNRNYWYVEIFKCVHPQYSEQVAANEARLVQIDAALANAASAATSYTSSYSYTYSYTSGNNSGLSDTEITLLNEEKKRLLAENNALNSIINFDCGVYMKRLYGGNGTAEHGAAKIPSKTFTKVIEKRAI